MSEMITVTGKDIYEAIEKDGFGALRQRWFTGGKDGETLQACLLGTAALNLSIAAGGYGRNDFSIESALNQYKMSPSNPWYNLSDYPSLGNTIVSLFDKIWNLSSVEDEAAEAAEDKVYGETESLSEEDYLEVYSELRDKYINEYMDNWYKENPDAEDGEYVIPTWEGSLQMAKDILSEVWDTPIEVMTFDYSKVFDLPPVPETIPEGQETVWP